MKQRHPERYRMPYWEAVNPYKKKMPAWYKRWVEDKLKEEKKMRNTIFIFEGDQPRPKFKDLLGGEMFRYHPHHSDPSNVYMKLDITVYGMNAMLLATGANFLVDPAEEVERISSIRISR